MKIFLSQINPVVGDIAKNKDKILAEIQKGKSLGAECILFPELAICGYPPQDLLLHKECVYACHKAVESIASSCFSVTVIIGSPRYKDGKMYNSAAIISDGRITSWYDKVLLPTYDVFDEARYFFAGEKVETVMINGLSVAITICEDLWKTDQGPLTDLKEKKIDLLCNLSASPFALGKVDQRLQVCKKAVEYLGCPLVLCNQVGGNDGLIFDGHSVALNEKAEVVVELSGFVEESRLINWSLRRKNVHTDSIERLYKALVLGIKDYFQKQNFTKAVLGLSGGIDSAVVAFLAVSALGAENVLGISMPSQFSSQGSIDDAKTLAKNLGMKLWSLPIEEVYTSYTNLLKEPFANTDFGVAEENLQARVRGMLLMAISNKFGHIVLATGNKSEMAMGYSTLYGDAVGGLAVISDVTKKRVYQLARYINKEQEMIPVNTLEKPPSAELREGQKDSDFLPPYDQIDQVVELYVEQMLSPDQVEEKTAIAREVIDRVVTAIHQNEYKRRQIPLGLRVTEKAFSTGRRFPIVQKWV